MKIDDAEDFLTRTRTDVAVVRRGIERAGGVKRVATILQVTESCVWSWVHKGRVAMQYVDELCTHCNISPKQALPHIHRALRKERSATCK